MTEQSAVPDVGYCPGCGEARVRGKSFCANCGRSFSESSQPVTSSPDIQTKGFGALTGADVGILAGAVLLIVAPFFPFLSATAALVGSISRSGIEITSGEALVLSAVGLIAGFLGLRNVGRQKGAIPILVGLIGLALTTYYYLQVDERVQEIGTDVGFASVGAGVWLAFAGSAVVIVATLIANRRRL